MQIALGYSASLENSDSVVVTLDSPLVHSNSILVSSDSVLVNAHFLLLICSFVLQKSATMLGKVVFLANSKRLAVYFNYPLIIC